MFAFLEQFVETIKSSIDFLVNIVTSTVRFIGLIPTYVNYLNDLMSWVPVPFGIFMGIGLTITIVLVLINRIGS